MRLSIILVLTTFTYLLPVTDGLAQAPKRLAYYATGHIEDSGQITADWQRWGDADGSWRVETIHRREGRKVVTIAVPGRGVFDVNEDCFEAIGPYKAAPADVPQDRQATRAGSHFGLDSYLLETTVDTDLRIETWFIPALGLAASQMTSMKGHQIYTITDAVTVSPVDRAKFALTNLPVRYRVEGVKLTGYHSVLLEEIKKRIKTQPRSMYDEEQVKQEFQAILEMGVFDPLRCKLVITEGPRGGVIIAFDLGGK